VYYCPYCSASAEADNWFTVQQQAYIQQQAMVEISPLLYRLQEQLKQVSQSGLVHLDVSSSVPVEPESLMEYDDMVQLEFPCHAEEPIKVY
jgi:hypothetical protein